MFQSFIPGLQTGQMAVKCSSIRDPVAMSGINDDLLDSVDRRNKQMIDTLGDKTQKLLELTRTVRHTLSEDISQLEALDVSSVVVAKGHALIAGIADDPTYFGVGKIAICVFLILWAILLLLRFAFRLIRRK
jgi:hypothetical protein